MMHRLASTLLAGLLGLTACKEEPPESVFGQEASPILYEVTNVEGETEAWLFGTIHALPNGVDWRTETLDQVVEQADFLILEIAEIEDQRAMAGIFNSLAVTSGQPHISRKVPEEFRPALLDLINRAGLKPSDFRATETWAAALTLAQVGETGDSSNGADRALKCDFSGREVLEFEGTRKQLGIFDQLPEQEQRELLVEVILDVERAAADPGKTRHAWFTGNIEELEKATETGLLADEELRAALLVNRNLDWMAQLESILPRPDVPLIAVGTAHLVGPDGLQALLKQQGYIVTRIQ